MLKPRTVRKVRTTDQPQMLFRWYTEYGATDTGCKHVQCVKVQEKNRGSFALIAGQRWMARGRSKKHVNAEAGSEGGRAERRE